jgi:hypothetical protein
MYCLKLLDGAPMGLMLWIASTKFFTKNKQPIIPWLFAVIVETLLQMTLTMITLMITIFIQIMLMMPPLLSQSLQE